MRARRVLLLLAFVALTVVLRILATDVCDDDSARMLIAITDQHGQIARWYHAGYLALASLLVMPFGSGHEASALLWVSALALAISLRCATSRDVRSACAMGVATLVAVMCHRSAMAILPGIWWIASSGRSRRRWALNALGMLIGLVVATWINSRGESLASTVSQDRTLSVIGQFWSGFNFDFVLDELLLLWFPVLIVPLLLPPRDLRRSMPVVAAAAPSLVFYVLFGVRTLGGYFTGAAPFLAAAGARDRRPSSWTWRSWRGAFLGVVATTGLVIASTEVFGARRQDLERILESRLQVAEAVLPHGGCLISVDGSEQSLNGRRQGLSEYALFASIADQVARGAAPASQADALFASILEFHEQHLDVALDIGWYAWADFAPIIESQIGDVVARFRALPHVYVVETVLGQHLVWPAERQPSSPRARSQSVRHRRSDCSSSAGESPSSH